MEQIGNALTFYAFFIDTKVGATGLTVTVDVFRNGTLIVTAGSATNVGDGLYSYALASGSVTVEGVYIAVFKTATTTVDQRHLASAYLVGTAGIEFLDATISSRATPAQVATELATYDGPTKAELDAGLAGIAPTSAASIWAYSTRTLTQTAASAAAAMSSSAIVAVRGDTLIATLTGLGDISDRTKFWITVKRNILQADAESTIQVEETAGLLRLNGAAGTAGDGSLTVTDETVGTATLRVEAVAMAALAPGGYTYDLQLLEADGTVRSWSNASLTVIIDTTRAIA